jgi:hypothetical protein
VEQFGVTNASFRDLEALRFGPDYTTESAPVPPQHAHVTRFDSQVHV